MSASAPGLAQGKDHDDMAEEFVLMTHPDKGDQPVRARKVGQMEALGWKVADKSGSAKKVPKRTTETPKENA